MNTEYVWWAIIAILAGAGAVAYLALGPVPEIGDEAPEEEAPAPAGDATGSLATQNPPLSSTVPGPSEPALTRETP